MNTEFCFVDHEKTTLNHLDVTFEDVQEQVRGMVTNVGIENKLLNEQLLNELLNELTEFNT